MKHDARFARWPVLIGGMEQSRRDDLQEPVTQIRAPSVVGLNLVS